MASSRPRVAAGGPAAPRARSRAPRAAAANPQSVLDRKLLVLGLTVANGYEEDAGVCVGLCRQAWREGFLLTSVMHEAGKRARKAALAWAAAAPARAVASAARAAARLAARAGAAESAEERSAAKDVDYTSEYACPHQATRLHFAASRGLVDRTLALLQSGAAVNARSNWGTTPLSAASQNGHAQVVAALLAAPGVAVNAADVNGWAPLGVASMFGHAAVVSALLAAPGVDVNDKSTTGATALYAASQNGHVAVVAALLASPRVSAASSNNEHWMPLHIASRNGHAAIVHALLEHGSVRIHLNHSVRDPTGYFSFVTPLRLAMDNGHRDVAAVLKNRGGSSK